jgi:hypothetical protein
MRLTRPCLSPGTTRDIGHPDSHAAPQLQRRAVHVPERAEPARSASAAPGQEVMHAEPVDAPSISTVLRPPDRSRYIETTGGIGLRRQTAVSWHAQTTHERQHLQSCSALLSANGRSSLASLGRLSS